MAQPISANGPYKYPAKPKFKGTAKSLTAIANRETRLKEWHARCAEIDKANAEYKKIATSVQTLRNASPGRGKKSGSRRR